METQIRQGQFEVIDSFAIRRRNEFYLIGKLIEGIAKENWFINVPFNKSFSLPIRIKAIEDVEISSEKNKYTLLIVDGDSESIDFLLRLKIELEHLKITAERED
jgi:tmRNA-binding protein